MTPFGLLLIVLTVIICFFLLLIINHLVIRKMMSQSGVAVYVQKIKNLPEEKEEVAPPPQEEQVEPKRKSRERVESDIKPSVEGETPKLIEQKGNKAEIRKKMRKNIMQSEIFRRIWS